MGKSGGKSSYRNTEFVNGRAKGSFWQIPRPTGCKDKAPEGVLALELTLQKSRLEPITGRKLPLHGPNVQETGVRTPSAHWRGVFTELPALATPLHHLLSPPAPACCPSENQTPTSTQAAESCVPSHLTRPVSCPSSLCSSERAPPENVSHTAFRRSLAAAKATLQLPHMYQISYVPLGEHTGEVVPRSGHAQSDECRSRECSPSFGQMRTEHEIMMSRWSTIVDLSHGAQGVVSKLRGQMHGPGPLFCSMPVQDLTMQVPIRKGHSSLFNQGFHKRAHSAFASTASCSSREVGPGRETLHCIPCTQPQTLVPGAKPRTPQAKMPLQSLMTAVHEVSEVLHVLGKHHKDLSRALFERLISWSSDMAQSACFVAELDFTVPKVVVEKAHQVLSQQDCRRRCVMTSKGSPKPVTPDKGRRMQANRCPTRDRASQATRARSPECQPATADPLRTFTPPLRVRGISRPEDCGIQPMAPAAHPAVPVSIIHEDTCESEFEVQGLQLLHESLWDRLESDDMSLRGLVCNHAHTYLAPRNPSQSLQPVVTPAPRRERVLTAESSVMPRCHPSTAPRLADTTAVPSVCDMSHARKPSQMFGWDITDQIPAVSAFYEGGVNSTEAVVAPSPEARERVSPEIWDYLHVEHA